MNMKRSYNETIILLNENIQKLSHSSTQNNYKKLLFCLVFFHSLLLERRKFDSLGWNIPYTFTQSDFKTSSLILKNMLYLTEQSEEAEIPWNALKYLICDVVYGGRISDNNDRKLVNVYVHSFFNEKCIKITNYQLSELSNAMYIPDGGNQSNSIDTYIEYIDSLPIGDDHPMLFGQHPNADMSSHMKETNVLFDTLLSFEKNIKSKEEEESKTEEKTQQTREDIIYDISQQLLNSIPQLFNISELKKKYISNDSPLTVVMLQEIERYNLLLLTVQNSLINLQKGMRGLISISSELDLIANCVFNNKVPNLWKLISYPSLKSLPNWTNDLIKRCNQLSEWSIKGQPKIFWLSGFQFPSGFLTALLQTMARNKGIAIDNLKWKFNIIDQIPTNHPKQGGAYIKGLYLEGAGWNFNQNILTNPIPMKLYQEMPIIHFQPCEKHSKDKDNNNDNIYQCPTYLYPIRTGTREKPSFVCYVDLKCGKLSPSFWSKRGTALLLSLAD
eukprot:345460_1